MLSFAARPRGFPGWRHLTIHDLPEMLHVQTCCTTEPTRLTLSAGASLKADAHVKRKRRWGVFRSSRFAYQINLDNRQPKTVCCSHPDLVRAAGEQSGNEMGKMLLSLCLLGASEIGFCQRQGGL